MTDFLLELRSEEIPARMQAGARAELEKLFQAQLSAAGIAASELVVWSTPRRLVLIARALPPGTMPIHDEVKGPPVGAPTVAIDGFLKKNGLGEEALFTKADAKGRETYFAHVHQPARSTCEILAEAIPAIVRAFAWPKSMRWGKASASSESLRWVRPLSGIVAIFGEELVPCEIGGIASGFATRGHRFHCPGEITIGSAADYAEKLRACHVIVDHEERARIIRDGAAKAAADAGLTLVEDEGLVIENAGLTEWPVPLLGRFDEAFLEVPPEVIQLTARVNQKYFVVNGADGKLANGFVCTANIDAVDGGEEIVAGNRKVLAARLSDARFFWEQDQKTGIENLSKKLERIRFFDGLGNYGEKQYRVSRTVEAIAELYGTSRMFALSSTARLCKADIASETVGEFPELQGVAGSYLIQSDKYGAELGSALKGLYSNAEAISAGTADPEANVLRIADRLDSVVGFAAVGVWFKGSGDPYGIRQSAQAVIAALLKSEIRIGLGDLVATAYKQLVESFALHRNLYAVERLVSSKGEVRDIERPVSLVAGPDGDIKSVWDFPGCGFRAKPASGEDLRAALYYEDVIPGILANHGDDIPWLAPFEEVGPKVTTLLVDRLKVQQREAGVRHDLIDAVFALGGEDDLVRLLARVKALQAFMATEDGTNLLAGYKRAANILKQAGLVSPLPFRGGDGGGGSRPDAAQTDGPHPNPSPEGEGLDAPPTDADAALLTALDAAEPAASAAVADERFTDAMAALASLRAPIDAFFEGVMVNDPDEAVRAWRLGLLSRFTSAVHGVADFSKIEG